MGPIRFFPPLAAAALLASCATPEARLRSGLIGAGLPGPLAACMAERMAGRLSLIQLRRMSDLPRAREAVSPAEFLHRVRALGDTAILSVTASSAALCEARLLAG
jgi:hypothetical protein